MFLILSASTGGCSREVTAVDPAPLVSQALASQDRLPELPATLATPAPAVPTPPTRDEGRLACEYNRQMICDQQMIGAQEKCQRMVCEQVAGFWLLRDPAYAPPAVVP